ncbi:hypothetical protein [Lentzea sp. HUAS12]|uniref:hypothetical protein n=1 Tax=Lentzea sp. HUAS12 TaxID=2951806 RepID=UPI0020A076B7|nr:hypothetical protein [Lentzea sp. HUAS12]USX55042.1 hypothetical protein ND450_13355 [Lentzea sp. HUAS12]
MNRLIVAALCLFVAACGTSAPTTTTTTAPQVDDAQAVAETFETYAKAVQAKDGATAVGVVTDKTVAEYDNLRKLALTATEQELAALVPSARVLVYAMRGELEASTVRTATPEDLVKAAVERDLVSAGSIADVTLDKPAVNKDTSMARVLLDGEQAGAIFVFAREDGKWKFDSPGVFDLADRELNGVRDQKNLSKEQLFEEVLVAKYGAAKAAEVRKPLGG